MMNNIKSKKLYVCTTNSRKPIAIDDSGIPIYDLKFNPYPYSKELPKNVIITQEIIELDNGFTIIIRNSFEHYATKYRIIKILEDKEKKIGYQFNAWTCKNLKTLEEPLFLGGVKNRNVLFRRASNIESIKTPYDIDITIKDITNETIGIHKIREDLI